MQRVQCTKECEGCYLNQSSVRVGQQCTRDCFHRLELVSSLKSPPVKPTKQDISFSASKETIIPGCAENHAWTNLGQTGMLQRIPLWQPCNHNLATATPESEDAQVKPRLKSRVLRILCMHFQGGKEKTDATKLFLSGKAHLFITKTVFLSGKAHLFIPKTVPVGNPT